MPKTIFGVLNWTKYNFKFKNIFQHDVERDRMLSESVLKLHRYRAQGESDGAVQPMGSTLENRTTFDVNGTSENSNEIYEKNREWTAMEERLDFWDCFVLADLPM